MDEEAHSYSGSVGRIPEFIQTISKKSGDVFDEAANGQPAMSNLSTRPIQDLKKNGDVIDEAANVQFSSVHLSTGPIRHTER